MVFKLILAFLLGVIFTVVILASIASGKLKIFISDDPNEQSCLGIDLGKSLYTIHKRKYVLFRVKIENLNSQK